MDEGIKMFSLKKDIVMAILISALILSSLYAPEKLSASCWDDYPWGKSESTSVKPDWILTSTLSGFNSYVEIQKIDGGQINTQFVFLKGELVQIAMTIRSLVYSDEQLANLLWDPCNKILGPSSLVGNFYNWNRKDLNTWAAAGAKGNLLWVMALYEPFSNTIFSAIGNGDIQLIY